MKLYKHIYVAQHIVIQWVVTKICKVKDMGNIEKCAEERKIT